jgi:hypothetical protein
MTARIHSFHLLDWSRQFAAQFGEPDTIDYAALAKSYAQAIGCPDYMPGDGCIRYWRNGAYTFKRPCACLEEVKGGK